MVVVVVGRVGFNVVGALVLALFSVCFFVCFVCFVCFVRVLCMYALCVLCVCFVCALCELYVFVRCVCEFLLFCGMYLEPHTIERRLSTFAVLLAYCLVELLPC